MGLRAYSELGRSGAQQEKDVSSFGFDTREPKKRKAAAKKIDVHAELDALSYAARRGVAIDGATAYVTRPPCNRCLPALIAAGVTRVVYSDTICRHTSAENAERQLRIASECGVQLVQDVPPVPHEYAKYGTGFVARKHVYPYDPSFEGQAEEELWTSSEDYCGGTLPSRSTSTSTHHQFPRVCSPPLQYSFLACALQPMLFPLRQRDAFAFCQLALWTLRRASLLGRTSSSIQTAREIPEAEKVDHILNQGTDGKEWGENFDCL